MLKFIDVHTHGYDDKSIEIIRKIGCMKTVVLSYDKQLLKRGLKDHPDFIVGMGWLPLWESVSKCLDDIDEYREMGCRGYKICGADAPYDAEKFFAIYEKINSYKMPLFFHTGWLWWEGALQNHKVRSSGDFYRPIRLDAIAYSYPKMKMAALHMGHPWINEAAYMVKVHNNVYGDFVVTKEFLHPSSYFWQLIGGDVSGMNVITKMMFGTDNSTPALESTKAHLKLVKKVLDDLKVSPKNQERVFYRNALDILGLSLQTRKEVKIRQVDSAEFDVKSGVKDKTVAGVSDFVDYDVGNLGGKTRFKTDCWLGYDRDALHFLFRCEEPTPKKLVIGSGGVPENIWMDDCVEIFLAPTDTGYLHFIANSAGNVSMQANRAEARIAPCKAEARVVGKGWLVKISIPFSVLGREPKPGDRWKMNLCREKNTEPKEVCSWNEVRGTFHNPDTFGTLAFE